MKINYILWALLLGTTLFASACTLQNRYAYHTLVPKLDFAGAARFAVASLDQREYVLNGLKRPRFTGLFRSGLGIPYDMTTSSGKPVADEFTDAIDRALKKKGFSIVRVATDQRMSAEDVIAKAKATKADKIIMLTIYEWKGETFGVTGVHFNLSLDVLDSGGKTLASKDLEGNEILGGQLLDHLSNPLEFAKTAVPKAFVNKIELLLNSQEIVDVLANRDGTEKPSPKLFL